jgi:hypothetical protein
MSNDCATRPNYNAFMYLYGFRIVLIKVNVITNKHPPAYFDSSQAMKKGA